MYSNGKITAPVSIKDAQTALANSSTDLMTLCRDAGINIWSRWKPCRYPSVDVMVPAYYEPMAADASNQNIIMGNQKKSTPTNGTWGIIFPDLRTESAIATSVGQYKHDPPTGVGMYYARLKDFNNYSHTQPCPFGSPVIYWSKNGNTITFTCEIALNTDGTYGILPRELDGHIYDYVLWRPKLMVVYNGSVVGTYACTLESSGRIFLSTMPYNTSKLVFNGTVPSANTEYAFVGYLEGYKYWQESNAPYTTHTDRLWTSPTDNTPCGIDMPCDRVKAKSIGLDPSIAITNVWGSIMYPNDEIETNNRNSEGAFIYVEVEYFGGTYGYTFYDPMTPFPFGQDANPTLITVTITGQSIISFLTPQKVKCTSNSTIVKQYAFGCADYSGSQQVNVSVSDVLYTASWSGYVRINRT